MSTGVSLIELMVALSLVGVVLAGSLLSSSENHSTRALAYEGRKLLLEFDHAAMSASRLGIPITVVVEETEVRSVLSDGSIVKEYAMKPGVHALLTPSAVSFYPSGAASPKSIRLSSAGRFCEVVVSLRGRTRVECTR